MKKAIWNGAVLTQSDETIVIEGNHYFPPTSLNKEHFIEAETHSTCPLKGLASYYNIEVKGELNENAARFYKQPGDLPKGFKDHVAFWKQVEVEQGLFTKNEIVYIDMSKNDEQNFEMDHNENYHDEPIDKKNILDELEEARTQRDEYKDQLIRARSEIENQRKRYGKEIEKTRNFAIQDFVLKLLPAKDSMEKGLDISISSDDIDTGTVLEGIAATLRILNDIFLNAGLKEINPVGSVFDPDLHEAISIKKTEHGEANKVISVFQKGYLLHDRLIRAARVEVSGN